MATKRITLELSISEEKALSSVLSYVCGVLTTNKGITPYILVDYVEEIGKLNAAVNGQR